MLRFYSWPHTRTFFIFHHDLWVNEKPFTWISNFNQACVHQPRERYSTILIPLWEKKHKTYKWKVLTSFPVLWESIKLMKYINKNINYTPKCSATMHAKRLSVFLRETHPFYTKITWAATVYLWPCWFKSIKMQISRAANTIFVIKYTVYIFDSSVWPDFSFVCIIFFLKLIAGADVSLKIWLAERITRKTKRQQQSTNPSFCYSCYFYRSLLCLSFISLFSALKEMKVVFSKSFSDKLKHT